MSDKELENKMREFIESIPADMSDEVYVKKIIDIPDVKLRSAVVKYECDLIIDNIAFNMFGWKYFDDFRISDIGFVQSVFMPLIPYIPDNNKNYYNAIAAFFDGNTEKCFNLLKNEIDGYIQNKEPLDEEWFAYDYLIFKGAIPKLYDYILEKISTSKYEKGLPELIKATKTYYCNYDTALLEEAVSQALLVTPDSVLAKELRAELWYADNRWENALAILEGIEEGFIFAKHEKLFMMAWCKSKIRDRKGAIECYKKCLEIAPMKPWARNNLAYEYYVTKQYKKAEEEYHRCIEDELNLKYACSGYVRTLAALGEFDKADRFIKNSPEKIYKHALDELNDAKKGKKKYQKEQSDDKANDELTESSSIEHKPTYQFSKERILEDELAERLSVSSSIFGIPLKIYKRKGIYGRQWSFPGIGRIDLLAEDNAGNLYIIELKKDSGYDDAYAQTVKYVEWFEKSKYAKGKKVYGIICVNDPPKKLIKAIQNDNRIRLFEYKVSYTEIK
ncbi:endonuclease NucS domain-containing protein [Ruminococcus sp.]|uniref:endonuclease NucS domain-containing protein n=1 Tax=Ruminococcus sp. TaxID=41978 RepID=UPI0025D06C38|nr:endonuclease NucS domain-containing protein [Ruminococcus sp.]MCR4638967.1 endonuclease NucS [Ruminococcus sp.]